MAGIEQLRARLGAGLVIPACPLALTASRKLDERRQRALFRYYIAAGAGGIAVGVHTTQFAIREPKIGLFQPVLELAAKESARAGGSTMGGASHAAPSDRADKAVRTPSDSSQPASKHTNSNLVRIAGVCGLTKQALREATLIQQLGYDAALLSLAALKSASEDELLSHCRAVADIIPLIGFYLQPSVGGRVLPFSFWRRFAEIENVVAIKIAPFNRYQTIDVVRAVVEAGRNDIALYTGNDDNIVLDLITPYRFVAPG